MEKAKFGFNKRVSLVKKEVCETVMQSKELDNIKGTDTTGFYSLATIDKHLFVALDKYDLDLDLEILPDKIIGYWIDCEGDSEKTRTVDIDFSRIANVGKLQLMANEVQSEGAVKSYTRRYALTAILNLPSTDLIDNPDFKSNNNTQNNYRSNNTNQNNSVKKATPAQLKRYFAIAKKREVDVNYMDELILKAFNIAKKEDWLASDYNNFMEYFAGDDKKKVKGHSNEETISMLIKKDNAKKK